MLEEKIREFLAQPQPEARRIFHGRGQCYPGQEHLCVDWYPPVLLISAYAPLTDDEATMQLIREADRHQQVDSVLLQNRYLQQSPSQLLYGESAQELIVLENDLRFEVHPGRRQNAGLFMDTRLLRGWLRENSRDCNVLNLFAYTCSLSVAALAGGASRVTNVDVSKTSIAWGKRNHELNGQDPRQVKMIPHNLFTSWGRIKQYGRYDLVIVDPPTRQRNSFDAEKDYGSVIRKLVKCCNPGARIIAALNSPFLGVEFLQQQFDRYMPEAEFIEHLPVAPEYEECEPDKGLKISHFQLSK